MWATRTHAFSTMWSALAQPDDLVGTGVDAKVAVLFDWENRWALEDAQGPLRAGSWTRAISAAGGGTGTRCVTVA